MVSKALLLVCLYSFVSSSKLFKYLRRRYSHQQVQALNHILKLKGKCVRTRESIQFLGRCLDLWVAPNNIRQRVGQARARNPTSIERVFIRDEINKQKDFLESVREQYCQEWSGATSQLTFLDLLRFSKLLNVTVSRLQNRSRMKNENTLRWFVKEQHGSGQLLNSVVLNLSDVELSEVEKEVLYRGLKLSIPPNINKEEIKAEFEMCWRQLADVTPLSADKETACKAELTSIAHRYANAKNDRLVSHEKVNT